MNSTKTFRLFISSTFSDFKKEREVLQTKVFPYIKNYCSKKGYTFQPIDLRWGVNDEAQLDQKTLELCLNEVRSCKTHLHPNFLIMVGDRYGWIPLPYMIEKDEFETLSLKVNEDDKHVLNYWYQEDLNQLPSSYILKERDDDFKDTKIWEDIEKKLSIILQNAVNAVNDANLTIEQRRKYFFSATEAEVEEGIIPYIKATSFQETLIQKDSTLLEIDSKYIFGFFKNIDKSSKKSDKFINDDYIQAQKFKSAVKKELLKDNILEANTIQNDEDSLDEKYLEEFESSIIKFLENIFDKHRKDDENFTDLEIEQFSQNQFMIQKYQDFIGQDKSLQIINEYINSENQQSLIIHGSSGIGKSSLMAKAIETQKSAQKKVIYRFVGATVNSSSTKQILTSIFEELGIDIRSAQEKEHKDEKNKLLTNEDQESFEKFSERIYMEMMDIKDDVIVFIDAIDQIGHDDQFLWLPDNLANNIKIVISALDDEKYQEDSKYFLRLKEKSSNIHKLEVFQEPKKLLYSLLKKEQRTIQLHQEEYFLEQYKNSSSPLYINIAVQELKNWRSYDLVETSKSIENRKVQTLANTQKDIIRNFISNLYKLYHHNEHFVQKVLGYLYASRDGLSESELLQLLSTDEEFIKSMSPEDHHDNPTKELPLVHWSRLHTQLKPFLSQKSQDGEELIYFFHREFGDVVKEQINQKVEHESIIKATQILIEENQDDDFDSNRWGRLYITLIIEYQIRYENINKQKEYADFITSLNNKWIEECFVSLNLDGNRFQKYNNTQYALVCRQYFHISSSNIYKLFGKKWSEMYITSLNDLALSYKDINQIEKAIDLEQIAVEISHKLYLEKPLKWLLFYIASLLNLASSYYKQSLIYEAIKLQEISLTELSKYSDDSSDLWTIHYTSTLNDLASSYQDINETSLAIKHQTKCSVILEKLYSEDQDKWAKEYVTLLINLSSLYNDTTNIKEALRLQKKANQILDELYNSNPSIWVELYTILLSYLANTYYKINDIKQAVIIQEKNCSLIEGLYKQNKEFWETSYLSNKKNLASFYSEDNNAEKAISYLEEILSIEKKCFVDDPQMWRKSYSNTLNSLGMILYEQGDIGTAIKVQTESFDILKDEYKKNKKQFVSEFTLAQMNLAIIYASSGDPQHALKLQKDNYNILKKLYKKDEERWGESYIESAYNLATLYYELNDIDESLKIEKKTLLILKKLYNENNDLWREDYTTLLTNMASTYSVKKEYDTSIKLLKKSLKILKEPYRVHSSFWKRLYIATLSGLASAYHDKKEFKKAEKLGVLTLQLREEQYKTEKNDEDYIKALINLSMYYISNDKFQKAITLQKKSLYILKPLYKNNKSKWTKLYTNNLNWLSISYVKKDKIKKAIKIQTRAYLLLSDMYKNEADYYIDSYLSIIFHLSNSYEKLGDKDKSLELKKKYTEIDNDYNKRTK